MHGGFKEKLCSFATSGLCAARRGTLEKLKGGPCTVFLKRALLHSQALSSSTLSTLTLTHGSCTLGREWPV